MWSVFELPQARSVGTDVKSSTRTTHAMVVASHRAAECILLIYTDNETESNPSHAGSGRSRRSDGRTASAVRGGEERVVVWWEWEVFLFLPTYPSSL